MKFIIRAETMDTAMHELAKDIAADILRHALSLTAKDGATKFNLLLQDLRTVQLQVEVRNATRH